MKIVVPSKHNSPLAINWIALEFDAYKRFLQICASWSRNKLSLPVTIEKILQTNVKDYQIFGNDLCNLPNCEYPPNTRIACAVFKTT